MLSHESAEVAASMPSPKTPNHGIRAFAQERRVKAVFHFTRLDNLPGILIHGLLTRAECDRRGMRVVINDPARFDRTDAVCASIGFPNYKMFYSLRCSDQGADWAILKLNPSVLWESRCAFCETNAANARVTAIPIESRQDIAAFRSLFDDQEGKRRKDQGIPDCVFRRT